MREEEPEVEISVNSKLKALLLSLYDLIQIFELAENLPKVNELNRSD